MNLDDYLALTVAELQAEAKKRGIRVQTNATKGELIRVLSQEDDYPGRVEIPTRSRPPRVSSLVEAFYNRDELASETIVVRGYLGRSNLVDRIVDYLRSAGGEEPADSREALRRLVDQIPADPAEPLPKDVEIEQLIGAVRLLGKLADTHIPWRVYLTPRLDQYIDFHFDSMVAYRQEPKAERQDACTVWLRLFEPNQVRPTPYRVVQVTNVGPTYSGWLGGELVDDYLGQPGFQSSAWGSQSGMTLGNKPKTTAPCGG